MEWSWSSWLKDWWRLKHKHKIRRRSSRDGDFEDDIDGNIIIDHDEVIRGDFNDAGDDELCQCAYCMNGDLELDPSDGIDSDGSVSSNSGKQVIVGICAMSKKSQSKPMKEILTRLQDFEFIKIVIITEETILKESVEQWPTCDCLISFHSKGFPLDKAIQYAQLRKPYVINNLHMQYDIQDRRKVYSILEGEGIEIPRYAVLDRDSPDPKQHELVESEDHVEVNGVIFNKPFVEKPVSAEDHNIYIYYPTSAGGGSQRLFRKIGSRSSVYSPESRVRKTGSFIYEDFMPTDGTDVKVYTVGPDYAHAEARKSPALDGKVERDSEGKEIRYPVILSNAEKLISRKVCLAFKQTVCGFDLLRANGKSYVCDVNGFSFVKNSNKYYDDCAKILGNMILRELAPTLHIPWSVPFQLDDPPIVPTTFGKMMELRCVVAIIRHGDRTPKQKMKVEVRHPKFFEIFEKYDGYKHGHIKLKRPKQLQEILDVARSLLSDIQTKAADPEIEEKQGKLEQLKSVLEMYGHFSGINRKVQMKYQPKGRPRGSSSDDGNISSTDGPKDPSLVLILKWGGELTPAGRIQAEELGRIFRCMYPGGQGRNEYSGTQGLGLLRLHSTFRHDLKIYASDEGRVQMTAAAFAKGLLALEGELTPILVQMVKSANTNGLLDNDCDSSKYQNMAKNRLHELMQIDRDFTPQDREAINPGNSISINQAINFVKNPVKCCNHVQALIQSLLAVVVVKRDDQKTRDAILYHGETWELMGRRWGKIEKDFSTKSKTYDISKIPDIYDCIKYDLQHNQHTLQFEQAEELYKYAKYLADIVIPQEYGLTVQEKLAIGQGICTPLLKKIKADLQRNIEEVGDESVNRLNPRYSHGVSSPGRHVRTRLYFTSESHVHSLLTVLRYGGLANIMNDEQWRRAMEYVSMVSELNYMSQIVIMLYEDPTKDPSSEERFHVELHFSPGVNCCVQKNLPPGPGFRPHSRNDSGASKNASGEEDGPSTRIDEESEMMFEEDFGPVQTVNQKFDSPKSPTISPSEFSSTKHNKTKSKHLKSSNPITIGSHHTVSGHEAMDLAKRLTEQLAAQQSSNSLGSNRAISPDSEPRARSFEHRQHHHHHHPSHHHDKVKDGNLPTHSSLIDLLGGGVSKPYHKPKLHHETVSATNELPLSEINFYIKNPESPIVYEPLDISLVAMVNNHPLISPLATNERPLSSTCLATEPELPVVQFLSTVTAPDEDYNSFIKRTKIAPTFNRNHIGSKSLFNCVTQDVIVSVIDARQVASAPASLSCSPRQSLINDNDNNEIEIDKVDVDNNNLNSNTIDNVSETNIINLTTTNSITIQQTTNLTELKVNTDSIGTLKITDPSTPSSATILCTKLNNPSILHHQKMVKLNNTDSSATATSHHNNNSSSSSTSSSAVRRQRHSIAGQMNYFKLLGYGGFNKKMTTSTNSLFSTAVISGSSSAPNLRDMIPNTITSPSVLEGFGGVPPIRPLETLHNALSLKQIDTFLEKMTSAILFKTPASSPPKNPSTPVPTPQNSLPNASMIRSSWSGHSSMTNSTSALSSGGPSSPNISDMYSRGCPSSDMSASLISNDGYFGATPELSHMFPALDYDLSSVGAQLTLDQIDNRSLADFKVETRFGYESGDTTPVSTSSDWEFNTNDATKGSTTNELCTEEEEEETTLSTDTCMSTQGDLLSSSINQIDVTNNENTIENNLGKLSNKNMFPQLQSVVPVVTGTTIKCTADYDFLKSNLTNDLFLLSPQPSTSSSPVPLSASPISGTPKIDNKYRNNRIQKQISLYEKESVCTTEHKNLAKDVPKFNETPSNIKLARRRIGTVEPPNFLSAEDLEKSITNIEKNLNSISLENQKDKCIKTKSCVNLKLVSNPNNIQTASSSSTYSNNPGAVLVRESFIEPPRRVAKSFHGKTQYSNLDSKRRSSEIPEGVVTAPADSLLKKNNNVLSRQCSIPGTSSGYSVTSGNAVNNNAAVTNSTSRFRTRLVREISEPAPFMEDLLLDTNNVNNSSSATGNNSYSLLTDSVHDQLSKPKK